MSALAVLSPRPNSHPFQERQISVHEPIKIGRSVARARPAPNNAIYDCKVLSRNHALLWYENGKVGRIRILHYVNSGDLTNVVRENYIKPETLCVKLCIVVTLCLFPWNPLGLLWGPWAHKACITSRFMTEWFHAHHQLHHGQGTTTRGDRYQGSSSAGQKDQFIFRP